MTAEQIGAFRHMINIYRWYMQKDIVHATNTTAIHAARDCAFVAFRVRECRVGQERIWEAIVRWWQPVPHPTMMPRGVRG